MFKIYIPRYQSSKVETVETTPSSESLTGSETILLVEDELGIIRLVKTMLEILGYRLLTANSPSEAIRVAEDHSDEIHLLMTDVVMPEMNGRVLADRLKALYPNMKTLFMSGYTANVIAHHGVLEKGVHFIHKPFSQKMLGVKIKESLAG